MVGLMVVVTCKMMVVTLKDMENIMNPCSLDIFF